MVAASTLLSFAAGGGFVLAGMAGVLDGGRTLATVGAAGAARAGSKRLRRFGDAYDGGEPENLRGGPSRPQVGRSLPHLAMAGDHET